ncbi:MAG: DUF4127 family protein [Anaerolineaceae bacterium]|nr:DUF4127 family protein [Anaerolineaceae bacterium]
MAMKNLRLAMLPLDDRPPTFHFPQQIAAIAGLEMSVPPRNLLGNFLKPGNSAALSDWLLQQCSNVDGILIAVDMLAYGGLVASRSPTTPLSEVIDRLEVLRKMKMENPQIQILAASVILRISITASDALMARHYRRIIRFSELSYLVKVEKREDLLEDYYRIVRLIPTPLLQGYLAARQRNHAVNARMVHMLADGTLDELILLQEDASVVGPHLVEQHKLREMAAALGVEQRVNIYPGADEGTQTLLAQWINRAASPMIGVVFTSEKAAEKAVPYEDRPLRQTVLNHLAAAGCRFIEDQETDVILWVHTPCRSVEVHKTADKIKRMILQGKTVGLADVRYPNGSDPALMEALCQRDMLPRLGAYAGWNTAGNTIGTTISQLCAWLSVGQGHSGEKNRQAQSAFLWERMVDDWGYQRLLRPALEKELRERGLDPLNLGTNKEMVEQIIDQRLGEWAENLYACSGWGLFAPMLSIKLPWPRTFEVDVSFQTQKVTKPL